MDEEDFVEPSPKRQRTDSPEENKPAPMAKCTDAVSEPSTAPTITQRMDEIVKQTGTFEDQNEILDVLMQHVESEATPLPPTIVPDEITIATIAPSTQEVELPVSHQGAHIARANLDGNIQVQPSEMSEVQEATLKSKDAPRGQGEGGTGPGQIELLVVETTATDHTALPVDAIPPATEAIEPTEEDGAPQWEIDSSPYESSTDSDSSDSSDDSDENDEDADGDYAMLDPEEAARILMQGDGGSDDEGDRSRNKGEGSGLRTANEQLEDVLPIPDLTITEEMKIEELGSVEAVVENNVLIRAKVSGEYQVLESGSLLCLQNRAIAGVVGEALGRVEEPLYTVKFRREQDIKEHGLSEKGTLVYYVPQHSSFVFTQPLKAFKGSDASNFHDEEVGDDEMEFSDDEAEAEHKRQLKAKRQGRTGDAGRGRGLGKSGRGGQRGGYKPSPLSTDANGMAYGNGSLEMNYDDVEEGEEGYTPLARPANLHEMTSPGQSTDSLNPSYMPPPPYPDRGRGRGGRHRGGRVHDRAGRGGRGTFRGNHNSPSGGNSNRGSFQHNNQGHSQFVPPFPNPFPPVSQYPYSQPPSAPSITPHNQPYPFSVNSSTISPISPLPRSQFNFNTGYQAPQAYSPTFQHPQQQQQQQQSSWTHQMPPGFAPQFNNPALMQFAQQFQQSQQQQQQQQQQGNNGWQVNQAAAAEVQRQLEEMRRQQGGGHQ